MRTLRRILVVQPFGIGDALFVTPLLRALKMLPTVEAIDLLLGSRTEAVFTNNPHVDQIFSIDKAKWRAPKNGQMIRELLSLWSKLRGRYDLMIDLSLRPEYGFYGGSFLRIPKRIGFNFKNRGIFLTKTIPLKNGYEGRHVVDFTCDLGKLIGLEIDERFLEFYISEDDRNQAACLLRQNSISADERYLAVAPGGGESWGKDASFKRWPVEYFAESLPLFKERIDFNRVLVLGSQGERALGEKIKQESPMTVHNLCGEMSLGTCAALLEKSVLLMANDGGLVHLAHALHVPLVAFYGPVDPQVYGPYPPSFETASMVRKELPCRPCYFRLRYNAACADKECLTLLYPREVFNSLDEKNFWSIVCKEKSSLSS